MIIVVHECTTAAGLADHHLPHLVRAAAGKNLSGHGTLPSALLPRETTSGLSPPTHARLPFYPFEQSPKSGHSRSSPFAFPVPVGFWWIDFCPLARSALSGVQNPRTSLKSRNTPAARILGSAA